MTRRIVITVGAFMVMLACSSSQVISTLRAVVVAAEFALPIIGQASGASPATIAAADRYLVAVGKFTADSSDILAGTGSSAEKSARILQAASGIAAGCNCVGAGTPTQIVNVVNGVAQAVVQFLANFPRTELPGARVPQIEVKPGDEKELTDIRKRSEAVIGAIARKASEKK